MTGDRNLGGDWRSAAATGLLDELTAIVSRAAAAILAVGPAVAARRSKPDLSPVSEADEAAQAVIFEGLSRLLPGVPVVSEEAAAQPSRLGAHFILVDPLDGTREFLAGRDEFTVNLALIGEGKPLVGLIAAPRRGLLWRGVVGHRADRLRLAPGDAPRRARDVTPVRARRLPVRGRVAVVSRSHLDARTEEFLASLPEIERRACGSSLKFCHLAEGSADVYPRLAPTREWDVAAGHAVLAASGGVVRTPDGTPLTYGRLAEGFHVPEFIAWGDPLASEKFKP